MERFPNLFSAFAVPPLRLKNRITLAPLFTGYASPTGEVSPLTLSHYRELACGGAAMIVVANAAVDPHGILSRHSLRADGDRFVPGLTRLASAIKREGALAVLQLNHGGRYARGETLYAPSSVPLSSIHLGGLYKTAFKPLEIQEKWTFLLEMLAQRPYRPREMTQADIDHVIGAYATAASRVRRSGFDMVEIHGATGYLPVQFLSPRTNRRSDVYGGTLENRMRFPLELIGAIRQAVGADFPVGYRFLADEWLPGGVTLAEAKRLAGELAQRGVAYLSVTAGTYESLLRPEIMAKTQELCYMTDLAGKIKATVATPVIASGRIATPELAERVLQRGQADLIGLARPLFTDPCWPQKAARGQAADIVPCSDCGTCFQRIVADRAALCAQWDRTKRIQRQGMLRNMQNPHEKILLAMDGSENAAMGAAYAGKMLSGRTDITLTLLHIQTDEGDAAEMRKLLETTRSQLVEAGIPPEAIVLRIQAKRTGVARDILREIDEGGYGTVVVGRRGLSRTRQFFFGSVSNKILQSARDCTVWVVD
jgi:2,4-dienoyl-CoA reductase-like NADH-dependent reductase (Old Yellow Enzyme family)/nucleotide-binding universal stress UspA family protein